MRRRGERPGHPATTAIRAALAPTMPPPITSCQDADDVDEAVRAIRQGGAAGNETRIVLRS
ncbi:MAG TPA: hypothetical protein VGC32_10845 [Solirubrobacterales bacterium]